MIGNYNVYVKANAEGYITAVNSDVFIANLSGWTKIDEGNGDKYHHAQGNYFPKPIYTDSGACRYKLVDSVPVECTAEEISEQEAALLPETDPGTSQNAEQRLAALAAAVERGLTT